jgi:hypothetical protein
MSMEKAIEGAHSAGLHLFAAGLTATSLGWFLDYVPGILASGAAFMAMVSYGFALLENKRFKRLFGIDED